MAEYIGWIGFHLFLIIALIIDIGLLNKDVHEIKFKEALTRSAIWFVLAMIFNVGVYYLKGHQPALEFFTGYVIEWSLSVDNLFIFITIFSVFAVPHRLQHRVLFWGILGALAMRALFIFTGVALLNKFTWIIYVFGGFLLITGLKLFFSEEKEKDITKNWFVRALKRWFRFSDNYHDKKFFVKIDNKKFATPLFMVLLIVEMTDLIFAADSIPAILAITKDPFIVYTSNVFAILGLRSLYFALAGMMSFFYYLRYGLAGVLIFVGIKLILSHHYEIPTWLSLLAIVLLLGSAIVASILRKTKEPLE